MVADRAVAAEAAARSQSGWFFDRGSISSPGPDRCRHVQRLGQELLGALILLLSVDLDPALSALRPLGGFFVLHAPPPLPSGRTAEAAPLAHAYAPGHVNAAADVQVPVHRSDPLDRRVRRVASALGAPEIRVAASVAQQGLAARLWSVTLACAVLYGHVPDLDPRLLHWDPEATAPDDLWLTEVRARPGDGGTVADVVLTTHLGPLTEAVHTRYGVATGLLRGNAASALAGAGRELDRWARRHGRTDTAARARSLTAGLLAHPLLAGTGTLTGTSFRRRSCCLYYRVPGGGVCGDCCFPSPPGPARSPRPPEPARSPRPPEPARSPRPPEPARSPRPPEPARPPEPGSSPPPPRPPRSSPGARSG
ncbi:(2Fe-2S)-binding protein [Streptomyces sp. NPDC001599]|uniref:(2Fe-2S)-binding protein n=1 Tax=Streptomyces sp. NPDC001599 TaxID=3364591 RepID=UPI0036A925FD